MVLQCCDFPLDGHFHWFVSRKLKILKHSFLIKEDFVWELYKHYEVKYNVMQDEKCILLLHAHPFMLLVHGFCWEKGKSTVIFKLCTVHVSSHPALPNCNVQCNWLVGGGDSVQFSFLFLFSFYFFSIWFDKLKRNTFFHREKLLVKGYHFSCDW